MNNPLRIVSAFRSNGVLIIAILVAILLAASLVGCGSETPSTTTAAAPTSTTQAAASTTTTAATTETTTAETITIVDSIGEEVVIPASPDRIASLRSGITEIILALGEQDRIVAVDEQVKVGESYGALAASIDPTLMERDCAVSKDVNMEELLRIDPQVVLHGGYGRIKQADAIKAQTDLPVVIAHFEEIDKYMDDIRIVAKVVDAEARGEELIAILEGELEKTAKAVANVPESDKVRVFYGGHDVYHAYTPGTFEHFQIVEAGGVNVAESLEGWLPEVSSEQLLAWDPQVIVLLNGVDVKTVLDDPKLQDLTAVKEGQVYALPEAGWDFSSPRALLCIEWLAQKLYPESFEGVNMQETFNALYQKLWGVNYTGPAL